MKKIPRNILVPTDLSLEADQALSHALYLARLFRADVHLLHVIASPNGTPPTSFEIEQVHERMESAASRRLEGAAAGLADREIMLHTRVMQGLDVVPAVLAYETRFGVDLIVMGTRGRSMAGRLSWQSHAEKIARTASCPVLTVGRTAWSYPGAFQRILVPVTLDGFSSEAISTGRIIAARQGADIDLLHVVPRKHIGMTVEGGGHGTAEREIAEQVEKAYRASSGPDVRRLVHVRYGEAAQVIAPFAVDRKTQLIVMSTRGAQGIDYAMSGSTTAHVVGSAPCPVLTLKQNTGAPALSALADVARSSRLSYT
jgi:nucleotide-binding universal stress UspA family protein